MIIDRCKFVNNSADYGGNLLLFIRDCVDCVDSKLSISVVISTFQNGTALSAGGGLHMSLDYLFGYISVQVYVTESQFISNREKKGGGVSLTSDTLGYKYDIIISGLFISENNAEERGGMYMSLGIYDYRNYHISIEHSKMMFNSALEGGGISVLIMSRDISESNTGIFDMEGVESDRVSIYFTDIIGNNGDIGSALKLQGRSRSSLLLPCENLEYV